MYEEIDEPYCMIVNNDIPMTTQAPVTGQVR